MKEIFNYNKVIEQINNLEKSSLLEKLDYRALIKGRVVPYFEDDNFVFCFSDSYKFNLISNIEYITKKECEIEIIGQELLDELIKVVEAKLILSNKTSLKLFDSEEDLENNIDIINFLNELIDSAIKCEASDIHIEPQKENIRIRFRVDGKLVVKNSLSIDALPIIITRIKVVSKLDLAERRLPQDGRITFSYEDRDIDLRISLVPTIYGEKIVIRLLDSNLKFGSLESLGLTNSEIEIIDKNILKQNGMTLVVGPTGSGKTTTIYSILNRINKEDINITTLEDPCEYKIQGLNQIQINTRQGLNFSNTLRNILRQDPDSLLIGELRDYETVETALRAAITGHWIISSLHVKDSISSIFRLKDMGSENFLISSALNLVISQRLVRRLCPYCKAEVNGNDYGFRLNKHFKASGCSHCNNGYNGRIAIFEILEINDEIKRMINKNSDYLDILKYCKNNGFVTMKEKLISAVESGTTSLDEIIKLI